MKRKILFSLICLVMILTLGQASYAAVEIVPSKDGTGKDAIIDTTISNSYLLCQGMKDYGGSLYGTSVLPHLATNKDWGAVSYLSNSIYGTNTKGGNTGIEVTIDGVKYYSTTDNITGVMNWGSNPYYGINDRKTQTSALISNYDPNTSTASSYVTELYNNKDTRYVEIYTTAYNKVENCLGAAFNEISLSSFGVYSSFSNSNNHPISVRRGLFGTAFGGSDGHESTNGRANGVTTFRPVIWNK